MKRVLSLIAVVALVALATVACNLGGGIADHGVTIKILDGMAARNIVPGNSLEAARYALVGTGVGGAAEGESFAFDLTPASPSANLDLKPGDWSLVVTVWNDETPSLAVGSGTVAFTVVASTPQTVLVNCVPYTGPGTLTMDLSWVPAVVDNPIVEVDMKPFAGSVISVPMTNTTSTSATGTASLEAGWYTGAVRLYDSSALSAGIVRAVRIAKDMTTHWTEYLTVSALNGLITMDVAYNQGPPLILTSNVTTLDPTDDPLHGGHGERLLITLVPGATFTVTVNEPTHDGGTTVAYAWYLNGVLTALSTTTAIDLDGDDYQINTRNYLSVVALQSDGVRAGSLNFAIVKGDYDPAQYVVGGRLNSRDGGNFSPSNWYVVRAVNEAGVVIATSATASGGGVYLTYDFPLPLPAGTYWLKAYRTLPDDPPLFRGVYGDDSVDPPQPREPTFPVNVVIPHPLAQVNFDFKCSR